MTTIQTSVLAVDDDAMNRDMLSRRLARHGYTVAEAVKAIELLSLPLAK